MSRHLVALSLSLALVTAACDGITVETTDTTTESTAEPTDSAEELELEEIHFAYLDAHIAVPMDEVDATEPLLEDVAQKLEFEFARVTVDEVLGSEEEGLAEEEVDAARSELVGMIQIYTVTGDPLQIAQAIRSQSQELRIAPIHAIGEAGHSGYQAGTDPDPREGISIDPPEGSEAAVGADLAAVVDSGIYPDAPWLDGSVEFLDPLDREPRSGDGNSHGTFVSSIIRELSPEHRITFARGRKVPIGGFAWSDGNLGPTEVTELSTEIHVAEAILRLVHRHKDETERVKSLNLAVGGYSIGPGRDLWMTTTSLAIDRWLQAFPKAPVFAAAGNAAVVHSFWPAALPGVTGVGALNDPPNGAPVEIVWDGNHNEVPWSSLSPTPRPSTNELAPGSQLAQYTQPELVGCWSGSSFATAVANGLHLREETSIPDRRAQVGKLSYCEDGKVVTNS